jgi:hypothetical protein
VLWHSQPYPCKSAVFLFFQGVVMFYKTKEHYWNTIQKVVREEFDAEISVDTEWANDFIYCLYKKSERGEPNCYGYDFLQYVKHKCESVNDVIDFFVAVKELCDSGMTIPYAVKRVFKDVGYSIVRRSI